MARECFVVSPFGKNDADPVRLRADDVHRRLIEPVCEEMMIPANRQDANFVENIPFDVRNRLERSQLVIGYLLAASDDPKNVSPNVLYEIGYRAATGKPFILLVDENSDIPFDLVPQTWIRIPRELDEISLANRKRELKNAIRDVLKPVMPPDVMHPLSAVTFLDDGRVVIELKNNAALDLFEVDRSTDVAWTVDELDQRLRAIMSEAQHAAWLDEQADLIAAIHGFKTSGSSSRTIAATIPVVIERHSKQELIGEAYLPIICTFRRLTPGTHELQVVYHRVTNLVARNGDGVLTFDAMRHFDVLWDVYALSFDQVVAGQAYYLEMLEFHLRTANGLSKDSRNVLELGCGTGNLTLRLAQDGCRVIAIDSSGEMLNRARRKLEQYAHGDLDLFFRLQLLNRNLDDASARPVPACRFDAVFVLMTLFAVERADPLLREVLGTIGPGGVISITEPKNAFDLSILKAQVESANARRFGNPMFKTHWDRVCHMNGPLAALIGRKHLPAERILDLLEEEGLEIVRKQHTHYGQTLSILAKRPA